MEDGGAADRGGGEDEFCCWEGGCERGGCEEGIAEDGAGAAAAVEED